MEEKIDYDFVEKLRLMYAQSHYIIDGVEITIVSEEETHNSLLKFFTISDSILKYYYNETSKYLSDDEFKKMEGVGFRGEKYKFLKPYPINIYGAYFHRIDLIGKLSILTFEKKDTLITINSKKVEFFEDLYPYFKNYAEGFKDGYDNFESECINKYLPMFPDKVDFVNKVFEFITKKIIFEHDWNNNFSGFSFSVDRNIKKMEISGGFENGKKQGRFYKAWKIVFSNNELFKPLFDKLRKDNNEESNDLFKIGNATDYQQVETIESDEVKKELHKNIFKDNAFEVFEKYHNTKNLAENSRTDLNLLFQLFKNDCLFIETVELKHYIKWLNETYGYALTELKRVEIKSKPNIQRTNDYNEYKKSTLKQP